MEGIISQRESREVRMDSIRQSAYVQHYIGYFIDEKDRLDVFHSLHCLARISKVHQIDIAS